MTLRGTLGWLALVLVFTVPVACGDEADCVDLCQEGQSRDCTSITGNCDSFCSAVFNVEDASGCADEREAYQDCLNDADDLCVGCDTTENALTNCLAAYCMNNTSNADCQTLVNSF